MSAHNNGPYRTSQATAGTEHSLRPLTAKACQELEFLQLIEKSKDHFIQPYPNLVRLLAKSRSSVLWLREAVIARDGYNQDSCTDGYFARIVEASLTALQAAAPFDSSDPVQSLQKQVDELQKENDQLKASNINLALQAGMYGQRQTDDAKLTAEKLKNAYYDLVNGRELLDRAISAVKESDK